MFSFFWVSSNIVPLSHLRAVTALQTSNVSEKKIVLDRGRLWPSYDMPHLPPLIRSGRTRELPPQKKFDSAEMSGRTYGREVAVAPPVNAGPMNGGVGPE